jgi:hypothetical protein
MSGMTRSNQRDIGHKLLGLLQRRFARAGWADDRNEFAVLDGDENTSVWGWNL